MPVLSTLSLPEWTVLALVDEAPTHGFAIAALTSADGPLGRIWQVPRPVVYRALGRLEEAGLVRATGQEPGRGPRRRVLSVTPEGAAGVRRWLMTAVPHVRDVRSHLLMKLALLDRRGQDAADLLERQRALLAPIVDSLSAQGTESGFDATLAAWRRANAAATMDFLDELLADQLTGRVTRRARAR